MRKDTGRTRARQKLFRLCNGSNACSIFETRARDVHSTECTELEAASEPRTWHEQVSAPSTSINCMRFRMQPVPDPRCLCFQRRARNATGESRVRKDHFGDKTQEFQGDFSWKLNDKLIRVIFLYGAKMDKKKSSRINGMEHRLRIFETSLRSNFSNKVWKNENFVSSREWFAEDSFEGSTRF